MDPSYSDTGVEARRSIGDIIRATVLIPGVLYDGKERHRGAAICGEEGDSPVRLCSLLYFVVLDDKTIGHGATAHRSH